MKNLLILGLTTALICILIQRDATITTDFQDSPREEISTLQMQGAASLQKVRCYRSEVVPIVGRIVGISGGGITIECPQPVLPPRQSVAGVRLDANAGNGASKNLAKLEMMLQEKNRKAEAAAAKVVSGVVLLWCHPRERELRVGMPVSVTAAPLGGRSYTVNYEIAPDPPGEWMKNSGSALAPPKH